MENATMKRIACLFLVLVTVVAAFPAREAFATDCTATVRFTDNAGRNRSASGPVAFGSGPDLTIDIFTTGTRFWHFDFEYSTVTITYSGFATAPFASGWEKLAIENFTCGDISAVSIASSTVPGVSLQSFSSTGIILDITSTSWYPTTSVVVLDYAWEPAVSTTQSTWSGVKALYR